MNQVAIGPVAVSIDANGDAFNNYVSGIYQGLDCTTTTDHAVTLVGYAPATSTTAAYWIVRNSWGLGWGMNGYIYMLMGNTCGIMTSVYGITI